MVHGLLAALIKRSDHAGRLTGVSFDMCVFSEDAEGLAFLLRSLALAVVLPRRVRAEAGRSSGSTVDGVLLREAFLECESPRLKECLFSFSS